MIPVLWIETFVKKSVSHEDKTIDDIKTKTIPYTFNNCRLIREIKNIKHRQYFHVSINNCKITGLHSPHSVNIRQETTDVLLFLEIINKIPSATTLYKTNQ